MSKKILSVIAFAAAAVALLIFIRSSEHKSLDQMKASAEAKKQKQVEDSLAKASIALEEYRVATSWKYDTLENKISTTPTVMATLRSIDTLQFNFPYDGGTFGYIVVRRMEGKLDVMFQVGKGQIHNDYNNPAIRVKFDDDAPINWSYNEPIDNSNDLIFLKNEKRFLDRLMTSKKVVIQCGFYNNGSRQIEFRSDSLKWE